MAAPRVEDYDEAFPADPGRGRFAAWNFDGVAAGPERVQVGVDLVLGGNPRGGLPQAYLPCQSRGLDGLPDDPFYAACQTGAYYRFLTASRFPRGIFLGTEEEGLRHLWGQRVVTSALEIYPRLLERDENGAVVLDAQGREVLRPDVTVYGRVRIGTTMRRREGRIEDAFPVRANAGSYTRRVGEVSLPRAGEPGVGRINGYATRADGTPGVRGEFHMSVFQRPDGSYRSSAGYPIASFGAGDNTNDKGYYTSGILRPGTYDGNAVRYRLDADGRATRTPELHLRFTIRAPVPRLDFDLDAPDLGLSRYASVSNLRPVDVG